MYRFSSFGPKQVVHNCTLEVLRQAGEYGNAMHDEPSDYDLQALIDGHITVLFADLHFQFDPR
jgi:hypothetical protein